MSQHQIEKHAKNLDLYYPIGIVAGILTAACIEISLTYLISGAVTGLLFTAFFLNVLVKGRADV